MRPSAILFILPVILFILIFCISYLSYRLAFYAPKRFEDEEFKMPTGEQYEKKRTGISKCVNEMLARPFVPVTITSHDGLNDPPKMVHRSTICYLVFCTKKAPCLFCKMLFILPQFQIVQVETNNLHRYRQLFYTTLFQWIGHHIFCFLSCLKILYL